MLKKPSLYFKSHGKGFTLIELLVVIAILGLIASIAVTALNAARLRSRDSRRLGDMENMRKIFGVLLSNNDSYIVTCTNNQISTCNFSGATTATNIKDPVNSTTACTGNNATQCNYAFWNIPSGKGMHYLVFFRVEGATNIGNTTAANCYITEKGIYCASNVSFATCTGSAVGNASWAYCKGYDFDDSGTIAAAEQTAYSN